MIKIKGNVCTGLILTTIYKINMVKKNNKYQTIGIESYNFNAEKEKRFYRYLSMKTMKKKEYGMFLEDLRELNGYTGAVKPPVRMTGNRESGHKETGMCAAEPPSRRRCSSGWAPVNGLLLLFA